MVKLFKTYEVILDIEKELYSPTNLLFSVSNNDFESIELTFKIVQDNQPFDLTGKTVELAIKKPSGLTVYDSVEITNPVLGEATIKLSVQAYIEYGIHMAEIYIRDTNHLAVTCPFWYSSRSSIMENQAIESTNEWSALQQALFAYDLKPILTTGYPTATPEYVGQLAFDTVNRLVYLANDLTAVSWQPLSGGGGEGGSNDTILGISAPVQMPARIGQLFINTTDRSAFISTGATADDWEQIDFKGIAAVDWTDILNKPATFPAEVTEADLLTGLAAKADLDHVHTWTEITGKPLTFPAEAHDHAIADVTGLQATLDGKADNADLAGKADLNHAHTWTEITAKPTTFAPAAHDHAWTEITAKPTTFTPSAHNHAWTEITAKPLTFPAEAHDHAWTEITGKPLTFTPSAHDHAIADVTGLQLALDGKADDADLVGKADAADLAAKANAADVYTKTETYNKTEVDTIVTGITEGGGTIVEDNLTSISVNNALSANQGRLLNETKAAIDHDHAIADVTGLQLALDGKADDADLTGKADLNHAHAILDVTGLQAALDGKADDADLTGKADSVHDHAIADVTGLQLALDGKADDADLTGKADLNHAHTWTEITDKPLTFPAEAHDHAIADVTGLQLALDGKADDADLVGKADAIDLAGKADLNHAHTWTEITAKPLTFPAEAHDHAWTEITDKPLTFPAEVHDHAIADVTGLQTALDGKADAADLAAKANAADVYKKIETYTKTEVDAIATGISEGGGTIVQDNLTSVSTTAALSANQGRVLNETKAAIDHDHAIADVTGLQAALDGKADDADLVGKADAVHSHAWTEITAKPLTFPAEAHDHAILDVTGLQAALDGKADDADLTGKADAVHSHTWTEITAKPTAFTPAAHDHAILDVTGLQAALDGKADDADLTGKADAADLAAKADLNHSHTWTEITAKPLTFPAEDHDHAIADVTGLQLALDGKADDAHGHAIADVTGLQTTLDGKADDIDLVGKADAVHSHAWTEITAKPLTFPAEDHDHTIADVTGLQIALDGKADDADLTGKADAVHSHTWTEITAKPTTFTPSAHDHAIADVTGLQLALDGKADDADLTGKADAVHSHTWTEITAKPLAFPAEDHDHVIADVTGLQAALDGKADDADLTGKANAVHTHASTEITDFTTAVDTRVNSALAAYIPDIPAEFLTEAEGDLRYQPIGGGGGGAAWGEITGTLANQTDLQGELNNITDNLMGTLKLKQMTQAAYDAAIKDPSTIYFIVG